MLWADQEICTLWMCTGTEISTNFKIPSLSGYATKVFINHLPRYSRSQRIAVSRLLQGLDWYNSCGTKNGDELWIAENPSASYNRCYSLFCEPKPLPSHPEVQNRRSHELLINLKSNESRWVSYTHKYIRSLIKNEAKRQRNAELFFWSKFCKTLVGAMVLCTMGSANKADPGFLAWEWRANFSPKTHEIEKSVVRKGAPSPKSPSG